MSWTYCNYGFANQPLIAHMNYTYLWVFYPKKTYPGRPCSHFNNTFWLLVCVAHFSSTLEAENVPPTITLLFILWSQVWLLELLQVQSMILSLLCCTHLSLYVNSLGISFLNIRMFSVIFVLLRILPIWYLMDPEQNKSASCCLGGDVSGENRCHQSLLSGRSCLPAGHLHLHLLIEGVALFHISFGDNYRCRFYHVWGLASILYEMLRVISPY